MSSPNTTHTSSSLLLDIEENLSKKTESPVTSSHDQIGTPSFLRLGGTTQKEEEKPKFAPSELLARLQCFLPQIKEANEKLANGEAGTLSDCVEIIENDEEENQDAYEELDEEPSEHKPYVEMNVVLGVLEEKKKSTLITDLDEPTEDEQHLEEKGDEIVNLRVGKEFTPQENKNIEQDMVAYMNIMNSLLGSSSALKRKREENDNSDCSNNSDSSSDSDQD